MGSGTIRDFDIENVRDALRTIETLQSRNVLLERVYLTGLSMRETAIVDNDFPEMMFNFDSALRAAKPRQDKT